VSGLALAAPDTLLSVGHDGTLRLWSLATMKPLLVWRGALGLEPHARVQHVPAALIRPGSTRLVLSMLARTNAHGQVEVCGPGRAPITCLEWCADRQEAALCTQSSKAYVWGFKHPTQPRLLAVLDHAARVSGPAASPHAPGGGGDAAAAAPPPADVAAAAPPPADVAAAAPPPADVVPSQTSDMVWLTRSDLEGLPAGSQGGSGGGAQQQGQQGQRRAQCVPDIVAEAIRDAAHDIPEATQARWAAFRQCWVTAADDGSLRLWGPGGAALGATPTKGGRLCALFVDEGRELVLAAAADRCVYVYRLGDPVPLARWG
jgi:hypothetical protein